METNDGSIDIQVKLNAEEIEKKFKELFDKVTQGSKKIEDKVNESTKSINQNITQTTKGIEGKIKAAFSVVAIEAFLSKVVSVRGEFAKLEVAFSTMLKSKEKGNQMMAEVVKMASVTPFSVGEVASGAKQLLSFGVSAQEIIPTLTKIGDVSAGVGADISRLILVFGQVKAQGRLMTNDLMQFMNAGIPILSELGKVLGKTDAQIKEMVTEGKIGFKEIEQVFTNLSGAGGQFEGLMKKQSQTLAGSVANLEDAFEQMFNKIGKDAEPYLRKGIDLASSLVENYQKIGKVLAVLISTYGAAKAAYAVHHIGQKISIAMAELETAGQIKMTKAKKLATLAQQRLNLVMLANPYVLAGAALAGVITAIVLYTDRVSASQKATENFNKAQGQIKDNLEAQNKEMKDLLATMQDEEASRSRKTDAYNTLIEKYPEIFAKYKTEEELLKNIAQANKDIAQSMGERSIKANKDKLQEIEQKLKQAQRGVTYYDSWGGQYSTKDTKEIEALEKEKKMMQDRLQYLEREEAKRVLSQLSIEQKKLEIEKLRTAEKKKQAQAHGVDKAPVKYNPLIDTGDYDKFSQGNLGYLAQYLEKSLQEDQKSVTTYGKNINELKKEVEKARKNLNDLATDGVKRTKEELEKETKQRKELLKQAQDNLKNAQIGEESSKQNTKKKEIDAQEQILEIKRKQQDLELQQEKEYINSLSNQYQKQRELIEHEGREKAIAIERAYHSQQVALNKRLKDKEIDKEQYSQASALNFQQLNQDLEAAKAEQQRQNKEFIKSLLDGWQDYQEKKEEIEQAYSQKRQVLEQMNTTGQMDIALERLAQAYNQELIELQISSKDANTAISNIFGDLAGKSISELKKLQSEGEKAFANLKASGKASAESLKAIDDRLKQTRETIYRLSPLFVRIKEDFATLSDASAPMERQQEAFANIQTNVNETISSTQVLADVFTSLGETSLSSLVGQLQNVSGQASAVSGALKNVLGASISPSAALGIGAGVGILTSVVGGIIKQKQEAERKRQEAIRKEQERQLKHARELAELEHKRVLEQKQLQNVFVSDKLSQHLERLKQYNIKKNEILKKAKEIEQSQLVVGYKKKKEWDISWKGISIETKNIAILKSFKEKYGQIVDEIGNINEKLLESLDPEDPHFQDLIKIISHDKIETVQGQKQAIIELKDMVKQQQELNEALDDYIKTNFGELGTGFIDTLIGAVVEGTNAVEDFGQVVSQVMKNILKDMLVTDKVREMFDQLNKDLKEIYQNKDNASQEVVTQRVAELIKQRIYTQINPELAKGQLLLDSIVSEIEKSTNINIRKGQEREKEQLKDLKNYYNSRKKIIEKAKKTEEEYFGIDYTTQDKGKTKQWVAMVNIKDSYQSLIDQNGNLKAQKAKELIEKLNVQWSLPSIGKETAALPDEMKLKLKELLREYDNLHKELKEYVSGLFEPLEVGFIDNIVSAVEKGVNAFESFETSVASVMKNIIKDLVGTQEIKAIFEQMNDEISKVLQNQSLNNTGTFDKVSDIVSGYMDRIKAETETAQAKAKIMFDIAQEKGFKMYEGKDEGASRTAQVKGFAQMTQDQASELNAKFTLGLELLRTGNAKVEEIKTGFKDLRANVGNISQTLGHQLQELMAIKNNTALIKETNATLMQAKAALTEIKDKGVKIKN